MIVQKQIYDSINIKEDGQIEARLVTITLGDDGITEVAPRFYHRRTLTPGEIMDKEDARLTSIANTVWTPEVIKEWQDKLTIRESKVIN